MDVVAGQPSYRIESDSVRAFVSELGGHMGPVSFRLGDRTVEPLHLAPWAEDPPADELPITRVLRGDFFCMPFGGNETPYGDERYPSHGETANARWSIVEQRAGFLRMRLRTSIRPGVVTKEISLRPGETAVYARHTICEMSGPMSFGHHAMLRFSTPGLVSTAPFAYGRVYPNRFEDPASGGYSSLLQGARFDRLDRVPMIDGGWADLSRYPAREGFEDLVMVLPPPETELGWTAVAFPEERYLWLSLKDPRTLPGTVFWHSNGGRHYSPWNGRHRRVLGIEEVCSFFHEGLAESAAPNEISDAGFRTCHMLEADRPLTVATIMLVAEVPAGFDHVSAVTPIDGGISIECRSGGRIEVAVDLATLN